MKKNFLTHLITLCIATVIFVACSKDETLNRDAQANTSLNASNGKMAPDPNGGTVTGSFDPVPVTVDVAVVQGQWLLVGETIVNKESFIVRSIPPGVYDLRISYTLEDNGTQHVKLIKGLTVRAQETINLGTINLEETNN